MTQLTILPAPSSPEYNRDLNNNNNISKKSDNAFKLIECSICQSFKSNSLNEIQYHYFKLKHKVNKLLEDNEIKNTINNCLSLKELMKLVYTNSSITDDNLNRSQICMHLLHELKVNRNLSLINLNLFNKNNRSGNFRFIAFIQRVKIKCNCCNKIGNSFSNLRNHLTSIKHIFTSKTLIYLKSLQLKCNQILSSSSSYYIKCNMCDFRLETHSLRKHLISRLHLSKCLKFVSEKIKLSCRHHSSSSSNRSFRAKSASFEFKINNLIKIIFILVVNDVNLISNKINERADISTTTNIKSIF